MKAKRFAALALSLILLITALTVPAAAISFTDMTGHWAKEDVEYLATQGVVKGTSATTFSPDRKMTACEALLFCSRATGVDAGDKAKIAEDWADEMDALLPESMVSWAGEEMAVCLETGIISETELMAMTTSGAIEKSISRENLSMYLVRAMQLAPLAESLTNYSMSFADVDSISQSLKPYVYLLNMYGIVKGDQANRFNPQGSVTRAEMVTMLRRAIDFMDERGIYAELPEYTTYDWTAGTIAAATTGSDGMVLLTLNNELSGTRSVSLPANVKIYENNMETTTNALKAGQYARVNLNSKGVATSVRLGGGLTTYTGTVTNLEEDAISINVNGLSKQFDIDRFTEVQVGKLTGDRTLIDVQAGYSSAVCKVDEQGHLAALQLTGGTRAEEGIITSVETSAVGTQTVQVSAFNGVSQRYTVPAGTGVTINGLAGTLSTANQGCYVSMRVYNDGSNQVASVAVDTVTRYVQGTLRNFTYAKNINTATIQNASTGSLDTYNIAAAAVVRYNGESIALSSVQKGSYVTARLTGGEITLLDTYPGSSTTQGVISSIHYGSPTTIDVTKGDETVVTFELDLTNLPVIYRGGQLSSIDRIKTGDAVVITINNNVITRIDTTPQQANVTGTITRMTMESSGISITVLLSTGETATYTVAEGVSVTQDGNAVSIYDLKPEYTVAMVVSGEQVVSIEVAKSSVSSNKLTGTVLATDTTARTVTIKPEGSAGDVIVTADVTNANLINVAGGAFSLATLAPGDVVEMYGGYEGAKFVASLVIRL
jgi:hypothetical protein